IARSIGESGFTPFTLPSGVLGDWLGALPPPGERDEPPNPQDWSHGPGLPERPDPRHLIPVMVCEPPRAIWTEKRVHCILKTYLDAQVDVTVDVILGFPAPSVTSEMGPWSFLPRIGLGVRNVASVTTLTSVGAPMDQIPANVLRTRIG